MVDKSVLDFYKKDNGDPNYYKKYDFEHSPRLDFIVKHFKLNEIKNQTVADFGAGFGFLLKRLDNSNKKYGFDGALIPRDKKLCEFRDFQVDLDQNWVHTNGYHNEHLIPENTADVSFCFEVLEHLAAPYNALCNIKWFTKENTPIYISIPDERVTHNVVYCGLMYPYQNFEQFLEQMALPIEEHVVFEGDWPAQIWKCRNAPWSQKKLKFYKSEVKFREATPLQATNL